MKNKLSLGTITMLVILPLFLLAGILSQKWADISFPHKDKGAFLTRTNLFISHALPFSDTFNETGIALRYSTGDSLQNGVFISDKGLIKELPPINNNVHLLNSGEIKFFSEKMLANELQVFLMILPTSAGVLQQNLPMFSGSINQKNLIDNIYNQFAGEVATINVLNSLIENKEKYIYYRTENLPTSLGGYYIYSEAVSRMLVAGEVVPLNQFGVSYSSKAFSGSLYQTTPYPGVSKDILSYYDYMGNSAYEVTQATDQGLDQYSNFYNRNSNDLTSYLNGGKGYINITNNLATELNLLVIGDDTAISYLPFLVNHYSNIDFINIYDYGDEVSSISLEKYQQVLVAVDIENFTQNTVLAESLNILEA